jgi:hypothetical protein
MSAIETILSRMMTDPVFADAVFANADTALAEYRLSTDDLSQFKDLTRAGFEKFVQLSPEERKSLVGGYSSGGVLINHNESLVSYEIVLLDWIES